MQYKLQKGVVQMYSKTIEILEEAKREDKGITIVLTSKVERNYFPIYLTFKDSSNYPFIKNTTHHVIFDETNLQIDLQNDPPVVKMTSYPFISVKIRSFCTDSYFEQGSRKQPIYAYMLPGILYCEEGIPVLQESLQWRNSISARSRV